MGGSLGVTKVQFLALKPLKGLPRLQNCSARHSLISPGEPGGRPMSLRAAEHALRTALTEV